MSELKPLIVRPTNRRPSLDLAGASVTVLASADETGGSEVSFQSGGEGMGPPPHEHPWVESFYVLKGSVEFACGGESVLCEAGTLVHVPPNAIHAFNFGTGGGEMLEFTGPGSQAARLFRSLSEELGPSPDVAKTIEVFAAHGAKVHL